MPEQALVERSSIRHALPIEVTEYVDFYSSLEHATNMGKLFRPGMEPLTPNWRWLPIGYHGRCGSITASGTPVPRPSGQRKDSQEGAPIYAPSRMLDFERELAFVTGAGPARSVAPDEAEEYIFGVALLNDWSARDIQAWEYQPLGPFLGKSFATSLGPWIVMLDALEAFRVPGPRQEPAPLPHLAADGAHAFDIALEVSMSTERMRSGGRPPHIVTRVNSSGLYWSMAQQLAHVTSNGSPLRAGSLYASGTISGVQPGSYGSMAELSSLGREPILMPSGERRSFLEDGDTVMMSGGCAREGLASIGLGTLTGSII
jgi:fumarylacetoacetase